VPLFIVYPAEPNVLKQVLDVLGEPSDVEVEASIEDEELRKILKLDEMEHLTVKYRCRLTAEKVLELYKEYYEGYVGGTKAKARVKEGLKATLSFKARWYLDGLSAEFDGFKLRLSVQGSSEKAVEALRMFEGRDVSVEVDLGGRRP